MRDQSRTVAFSVAELCRRGWNRSLIQRVLGPPDFTVPNPHYPQSADMRLYARHRVEQAEKRAEFVALQDRWKTSRQP